MAIEFDGLGYIDLAAGWQPSVGTNFEVEIAFTLPSVPGFSNYWSLLGSDAQKGTILARNSSYYFYYEGPIASLEFELLATAPIASTPTNIRFKVVSSNSVEVYINGDDTPTETLTLPAGEEIAGFLTQYIGARNTNPDNLLPAGAQISLLKLTDLATPANSSVYLFNDGSGATLTDSGPLGNNGVLIGFADANSAWLGGAAAQTIRKSSIFDIETALGTITTATLNAVNVFDHITGQAGTTVSFEGAATDEITTSGEYTLTLGDGSSTEDITVQVNIYGVAPSNNPLQKDGSALASLTNVQVRVTNGANINGTELYYSGTATTDASGNLGNIDLSSTAAAVDDSVLFHMRTAAGDSIIAAETVELI